MIRLTTACVGLVAFGGMQRPLRAQRAPPPELPPTVAEASQFERTSTSAEVEAYVDRCVAASPRLVRLSMGKTTQGKDLPLVLVADPPVKSLEAARAQTAAAKRPLVFVMANIHAGEVEGKEAVQILLRELARGEHDELLGALTLAFVPDYNPDGNDKLDRKSRPDQAGPNEGVGQRANGQGLDLNRDFVKVEAPETKALFAAVDALDPVLVMDLHTTDGSYHGYDLTYAGIMHPACDPGLLEFTRATLLPKVQAAMKAKGFATFDYGDFDDNAHPEKGWSSFESKPRYGTNYFGFQNRLTLLSEAYSHAPFAERVKSTRAFVLIALEFARDHAAVLMQLRADADERGRALGASAPTVTLPTRGELAKTRDDDVLVGAVRVEKDPVTGLDHLVTTHESHAVRMPVRVTFEGRDERPLPKAWLVARPSDRLLDLVARHGLASERLAAPRRARVRVLANAQRTESKRPFQGHPLVTFTGTDAERELELPAGALVVPTDQPRSRLAFVLFTPTSDDGLGTWGALNLEPDGEGQRFEALQLLDWATAVDANEAVRALAERTQKLEAFTAIYRVVHFDATESEQRLYYRAPDRARFDSVGKQESTRSWLRGSVMSTRGVDRRGRYAIDRDLAEWRIENERFDAMLEREFARPAPPAAPRTGGPGFRLDFEAPLAEGEDSGIVMTLLWAEPKFHLLAWLDGGTPASPWQAEGEEFVRRTAKGGVVRVSKETGFLVSLTHPSGFEIRLVRASESVSDEDLAVPRRLANEEDRTPQDEWGFLSDRFQRQRRAAYEAALHAAPDSSKGAVARDARLGRVFSFIDSPFCGRMDADHRDRWAPYLEQFTVACRTQRLEAGDSTEKRAAVDAAISRWRAEYERRIDEFGEQQKAALEAPLDEDAPEAAGANAAARIGAILAIERAVFLVQFRETVRTPAIARLENALRTAETRH